MSCPYLRYDESHCAGCRGWYCAAFGRKKKLSDTVVCQDGEEWPECPRYIDTIGAKPVGIGVLGMPRSTAVAPPPPSQALPCIYLGMPEGGGCCHQWCVAGNVAVRSTKVCNSPPSRDECKYYIQGIRRGVKQYTNS